MVLRFISPPDREGDSMHAEYKVFGEGRGGGSSSRT
jgi:hypothetical protein